MSVNGEPNAMRPRAHALDRLILALALFAAGVWGLQGLLGPRMTPLTDRDPTAVHEIRVLRDGRLQLDLLRDSDGWMLTHPEIARARGKRVGQLLALLRARSHRRWPVSPELLAQTGLDRPARTLFFDRLRIDFGGPGTPPGRRYVRIGERIHLIDGLWFNISGLPATHFRKQP